MMRLWSDTGRDNNHHFRIAETCLKVARSTVEGDTMPEISAMNPGCSIAHYRVTGKLGEGGMGEVWRATDTKLNRDVAIKVLPESFAQDADRMARFTREARVLAALNHANIAQIYAVEDRALVMELVEGEPLHGTQSLETALDYARQIADALDAAHEKGITHRDLKPANIMVTRQGIVKVLDFGLAAVAQTSAGDSSNSPTLTISPTRTGTILGTVAYMAPEQARGKVVDKRADIWAFGVVLYEMLTGKPLFRGETVSDTLAAVLKQEPDLTGVPAKARRLLQACLQKDPKQRLQAIGDWRLLLEDTPERASEASGFWKWIVAAAGVAALLMAGLAFRPRPTLEESENRQFEINPPPGGQFVDGSEISPDGKQVALMVEEGGVVSIWMRPLNALEARKLPGTESARGMCWSPDSKSLAFLSGASGESGLKRIDLASGQSYPIGDIRTGSIVLRASWAPDDTILLVTQQTGPVQRLSASAGTLSPATVVHTATGAFVHTSPQFLNNGRHFVYLERSASRETQGIYVTSLDRPEDAVQLLRTSSGARFAPSGSSGYLLWQRGGALVGQKVLLLPSLSG